MRKNFKNNLKIMLAAWIVISVSGLTFVSAEETVVAPETGTAPETAVAADEPVNEAPAEEATAPDKQPVTAPDEPAKEVPAISADEPAITAPAVDNTLGQVDIVTPAENEPIMIGTGENTTGVNRTILNADEASAGVGPSGTAAAVSGETASAPVIPEDHNVNTGIIRNLSINGLTIIADWQMSAEEADGSLLGKDDSSDSRGQFLPSGRYETSRPIMVCALAGDADGTAGIGSVKAVINYPAGIAVKQGQADEPAGCGRLQSEVDLARMDKSRAEELLCEKIRNNNNNLLDWNLSAADNLAYGFEQVCGEGGYIRQSAADLFCGEISLAYNDPAGAYPVKITAVNLKNTSASSDNSFKYLELTTFENDFTDIQYGPVKLNEVKVLEGDALWGGEKPTVRNTGNTRLQIKIKQSDFGFGRTDGGWNISYQARVGSQAEFISYPPDQVTALNGILGLGETVNMDFSAFVKKFPESSDDSAFWGNMVITADKAAPLSCP